MVLSFSKIVKSILKELPANDYPVLNSRLFFETWLNFVLDSSLTSMRDLFYRLNHTGIKVDISTFSKACKYRTEQTFCRIYMNLVNRLKQRRKDDDLGLFAIDSTVISLTSQLFWQQKYYQVKLINGVDVEEGYTTECLIRFGQENDAKYLDEVMTMIPANSIAIMDRGYASWDFVNQMSDAELKFVVRIRNNMKTKFDHDKYRVVKFYDAQNCEYRLATNLTECSDEEVAAIYRKRWQIELLWKFLKMHLKLDHLITKNLNGVKLQIYTVLIAYLILQLIEIPPFYGNKLLEKLRYIQIFLHRHCSLIHWSYDIFPELLF